MPRDALGLSRGLFKGFAAGALREASYSSLRFGLYVPIKESLVGPDGRQPLWVKFTAGALAAAIGSAIANPTDLLKARMQADTCVPATTMRTHVREIHTSGGIAGFWKVQLASCCTMIHKVH